MGRLTLKALDHPMIEYLAAFMMLLTAIGVAGVLTYFKRWHWLWKGWLCSLDHKKIGCMYLVLAKSMLLKGLIDALMMRWQQIVGVEGSGTSFVSSSHFQQLFTAHGTTMIFFVGMGLVAASMNLIVPLQIGAREMALPFLNALSFWLLVAAAGLLNVSIVIGNFSAAGWLAYPPLSSLAYSPDVGVDYWIWTLQLSGLSSLLSGINIVTTVILRRCRGMTWMRLPLFTWCAFASALLIVFSFPILTGTLLLLTLDRWNITHFFTAVGGGDPMLYINLIWAWGHPEVYILILPAFGCFSEVVATFSQKRLFGYGSMIGAIIAIVILSFIVWLHHFFTMGASAPVNAFFGITTMLIALPTGVKVFNWIFTQVRGKILFTTPILWFFAFILNFTVGGMAGVLLALPAVDFQLHNSLFLVAHFHSMIIPGVVFGTFAGLTYWFPKFAGFMLNEFWGRLAILNWTGGFILAFMPLYTLGLMGATRRLDHYEASTGWQPLFILAGIGALFIVIGLMCQGIQLWVSYRDRFNHPAGNNPWHATTLEWSTTSPPPLYNFCHLPVVAGRDPLLKGVAWEPSSSYPQIVLPVSTPLPLFMGMTSFIFAFAFVWQISWLSMVAGVVLLLTIAWRLVHPCEIKTYALPQELIAAIETGHSIGAL